MNMVVTKYLFKYNTEINAQTHLQKYILVFTELRVFENFYVQIIKLLIFHWHNQVCNTQWHTA
jgi:hypothetical protein